MEVCVDRVETHLSVSHAHLRIPVIGFFELHVFPSLAAEIQPLPLQPFHGGFPWQVAGIYLRCESDVTSCHAQSTVN